MLGRFLCWLGFHRSGAPCTLTVWNGHGRTKTIVVDGEKVKYCPRCGTLFGVDYD